VLVDAQHATNQGQNESSIFQRQNTSVKESIRFLIKLNRKHEKQQNNQSRQIQVLIKQNEKQQEQQLIEPVLLD